MRVCLVSRELAPFSGWGVGTYAANAARALASAGHETHVLTAPSAGVRDRGPGEFPGVTLHVIDRSGPPASLRHVPCRATQGPLAIFETLRALDDRHPFDYIELTDVYAEGYFAVRGRQALGLFPRAVLAVRLHSPILLLRRINGQAELEVNTACVEHMEAEAIRGADVALAPSRAILELLGEQIGAGGWASRARVLPYPFPSAWPIGHGGGGADGVPEVLFAGRLEHRKGLHVLVGAARRLLAEGMPLRVRVIGPDTTTAPGGGSVARWVRGLIEPRWADRFVFEPNRSREEVSAAMRRAAVVCVPSLWENFPNVCLEAMACGRCVVAADAGGLGEIIRDGTDGVLFPSGDEAGCAAGLRGVLSDGGLRARLGASAAQRVRALCDPPGIVARLEAIVAEARGAGAHSARVPNADVAPSVPRMPATGSAMPRVCPADSVSVVVPFYNLARWLPGCLESVRAQTRPPDEILVIDDGSTDTDARELMDSLERSGGVGPALRVVRQANRGLSAARNAGVRAARSRWVLPLDADDMLAPSFIERALLAASRNPGATLVTAWMSCFEADGERRPTVLFVPIGFDRDLLCVLNVASSCTALLDREAVLAAGGYDETLPAFEDWDLYCALAARGAEAVVLPEALIVNRIRADSMLRRMEAGPRRELESRVRAKHAGLAADRGRVRRVLDAIDARARARSAACPNPVLPGEFVLRPVLRRLTRLILGR